MRYVVMYQRKARIALFSACTFEWHQRGPYRFRFVARLVRWWQRNVVQATDDDCNGYLAIREDPYVVETDTLLPMARVARP